MNPIATIFAQITGAVADTTATAPVTTQVALPDTLTAAVAEVQVHDLSVWDLCQKAAG